MMMIADFILAVVAMILCAVWLVLSVVWSLANEFAPNPCAQSVATAKRGCLSLLAALAVLGWLAGAMWHGQWGWLG